MKIIKWLSEEVHEEIHDANKDIEKALEVREEYPEVADLLNLLSAEEIRHMQMLHG